MRIAGLCPNIGHYLQGLIFFFLLKVPFLKYLTFFLLSKGLVYFQLSDSVLRSYPLLAAAAASIEGTELCVTVLCLEISDFLSVVQGWILT